MSTDAVASTPSRVVNNPASDKQVRLVRDLLVDRAVPAPLVRRCRQSLDLGMSATDAHRLIPRLLACPDVQPDHDNDGEYGETPEGYDDSPDQGVHRYDGRGTFF